MRKNYRVSIEAESPAYFHTLDMARDFALKAHERQVRVEVYRLPERGPALKVLEYAPSAYCPTCGDTGDWCTRSA